MLPTFHYCSRRYYITSPRHLRPYKYGVASTVPVLTILCLFLSFHFLFFVSLSIVHYYYLSYPLTVRVAVALYLGYAPGSLYNVLLYEPRQ